MPYSQHLLNFDRSLYPKSDKCDYYWTHRTIINHFYEQFFTQLHENKYQFPSPDFYYASFCYDRASRTIIFLLYSLSLALRTVRLLPYL